MKNPINFKFNKSEDKFLTFVLPSTNRTGWIKEGIAAILILTLGITQVANVDAMCHDPIEPDIERAQFLAYAEQTAQEARSNAWDSVNGGFYTQLSRDWSIVLSSSKSSLGNTFYIHGLVYLFDATGNSTYLHWATETLDTLLSRAWHEPDGGLFTSYDQSWNPTTGKKSLQVQADLLYVLMDLYDRTGNQNYLNHANELADFIVVNYHDSLYGGNFMEPDINGSPNRNKQVEVSQGAFGWGMMRWYESSGDVNALELTENTDQFTWENLRDPIYGGLMSEVNRDGSVIENEFKYPNVEMWGILGMLLHYKITGDTISQQRIATVLQHLRDTMWDEIHGGWYRSMFRDNTVRTDTKDGWSQSEQPWFWWMASNIMGDDTYGSIALMSARWTRDNNYDTTYGGFYLELNRDGTVKRDTKDDWVQGGGIAAFALIGGSVAAPGAIGSFIVSRGGSVRILVDVANQGTIAETVDDSYS